MAWDKLVGNVILPNNERVCLIIETKLHLLTSQDTIAPYLEFATHAYAYKVFRQHVYENYNKFQFPPLFLEHISSNREAIKKSLENVEALINQREI